MKELRDSGVNHPARPMFVGRAFFFTPAKFVFKALYMMNISKEKEMKNNEENKQSTKTHAFIKAGLVLGGFLLVTTLLSKNRKLTKKINNLEGQIENQKDVIYGLQKFIERGAFTNGKISRRSI